MSLLTREAFADLEAKGNRLREGLEKIRRDLGIEGYVVGQASASGLMMTANPINNYRELVMAAVGGLVERMGLIQKLLLEERLLTMRGGFVGSTPMTDDDVDFTLAGARRALTKMKAM